VITKIKGVNFLLRHSVYGLLIKGGFKVSFEGVYYLCALIQYIEWRRTVVAPDKDDERFGRLIYTSSSDKLTARNQSNDVYWWAAWAAAGWVDHRSM